MSDSVRRERGSLTADAGGLWMTRNFICPAPDRGLSRRIEAMPAVKVKLRRKLAFSPFAADIGFGRLAVDEPLANRVRSGRKQP